MHRIVPLSLLLFLVPASAADFGDLDKALKAKVADAAVGLEARKEAVNAVSAFGNAAAVTSLLKCVALLDDRLAEDYKRRAKYAEEYAPFHTEKDWEKFKNPEKKKAEMDAAMTALEGRILSHEALLEVILRELCGQTKPDALKALSGVSALKSQSWRARSFAGVACARNKEIPASASLRMLKDSDPRVRANVAEGFGPRKDPEVLPTLGKVLLKDPAWQVRATIVKAMEAIGSPRAIRHLIEALGKESGRLIEDIHRVLKKLSGQNYAPEYPLWREWYEKNKAKIEGTKDVAGPKKKAGWSKKEGAGFYGVKTFSKRMVFIIDTSGSMADPLGREGAVTGGDDDSTFSGPKIELAKRELKRTIRMFKPDAFFNIISFNYKVTRWQPKMVAATQKNKNAAYVWTRKLKPEASTYLYGALKMAFEMAGMGATDAHYRPDVDTILLLSDGAPTDNTMEAKRMDPEIILKAVRAWNNLSKITIHVIAIDEAAHGEKGIRFLKDLARENNGTYITK
jgi:HEAT repeats/von Willebrand factor type A domain